ncbi:MAG: hypothetical protein B7C24_13750 [Bacteroidetes bacterium 4572_77]|nr:MAG: hypothetical protein B7C24_13750 [Bacteroidetes bacterium 4572_77]
MKKYFYSLLIFFISWSSSAQIINNTIIDPDIDKEIFIGEIETEALNNPIFIEDWEAQIGFYPSSTPLDQKLEKIFQENKEEVYVEVYFASWCGDSQDYIPPFVELMKRINMSRVTYYALSRKKYMPNMDTAKLNIELVPTFIVFKGDEEIGRIIESPEDSLEKDLWNILMKL